MNSNTCMGLVISLCSNSNRHLLSCDTIEIYRGCNNMLTDLTSTPFDLKRQYFPYKLNKLPSFLEDFNFWNRFARLHLRNNAECSGKSNVQGQFFISKALEHVQREV